MLEGRLFINLLILIMVTVRPFDYVWAKELHWETPPPNKFQHLTVEDGLSHNTVKSIVQDNMGFMWFAVANGVNRFDGYNFKLYTLTSRILWFLFQPLTIIVTKFTINDIHKFSKHRPLPKMS